MNGSQTYGAAREFVKELELLIEEKDKRIASLENEIEDHM